MSALAWCAFVVAAAAGGPTRYAADMWVTTRTRGDFPWGTVLVNVTGSFFLGVLAGLVMYHGYSAIVKTVLGTGFCGAFTTFSTFSYETVMLADDGDIRAAVLNVLATVALGAAAAAVGIALAAV